MHNNKEGIGINLKIRNVTVNGEHVEKLVLKNKEAIDYIMKSREEVAKTFDKKVA